MTRLLGVADYLQIPQRSLLERLLWAKIFGARQTVAPKGDRGRLREASY